ncbi:MAG TPA: DegT/DnrJ/EryC1/StrS family aminotransferase [Conexibacter sp.]|nr:DegT/DnrJ/EryC1/StrS family aminotransferase [Conexibacter sp.]
MSTTQPDLHRFAIGFDERDRPRFHALIDEVLESGQWSHGEMNRRFEAAWSAWNDAPAVAMGSWAGGAIAALEYANVRGRAVLCPSNTFMATPLAIMAAGGTPVFVDCNRDDLCASLAEIERAIDRHRPRACVLVHIGGHIAFESRAIADACRAHGVFLLEDCAHAHGADWDGRKPGTYGDAGVYSFYATKTVSTGEGGILVSRDDDLIAYARAYRDYGKPDYDVPGVNFRMSEFTAAMGLIQTERMPEIVAWKNAAARAHLDALHPGRLELPDGMTSGLYKYIVFDPIEKSSGKVYDQPCHRIMGTGDDLPNTDWVAEGHWCVPLYYRPEVDPA